jgi:DNA-binding NtrC family response regulator
MTGGEQDKFMGVEPQVSLPGGRPPGVWLARSAGTDAGEASLRLPARSARHQCGRRILLIADDADLGDWLLEEFRQSGATVALATRGRDGLALVRSGLVDVVISEMGLRDLPGMDLLRELRSVPKMPKVILTTSRHSDFLALRAIEHGASAILCKPFGMEQLWALVERLLGD